ncbi:TraN protein, partial [Pseudomonas amygdali pv. mori]
MKSPRSSPPTLTKAISRVIDAAGQENPMKTSIALALWLAAGGYAWADETVSPEAAPAKSAVPPSAPVTPAAGAAPSGWATGVGVNPAAQKAGSPAQG